MYLVVGVVLSSATVLYFAWGFAQHRRAMPARWTRSGFLSSAFTLVFTMMTPAAAGPLISAVLTPVQTAQSITVLGCVAMIGSVALAWYLTPRLVRQTVPLSTMARGEVLTASNQPTAPRMVA